MALSWEQLSADAAAHRRRDARRMLQWMVAAQGSPESWEQQKRRLFEALNTEH